ncbi:GPO family capsid scaffolding protein [Candidatus Pantoea floridensis]|uniref:Phage capsid scaffolding protein (GPO) serine peptidase n=1 Tax=Candidatus Pantoea floridensis TaxID=1938870 RepID=A0A286BTV7_9GAMM|nr:GPO family capsid scaffolding protein [Pantoea floridensis]PIF24140.1 capsid scaffolding serine peptidase GPO [Enterobacteriaceae bacterium JKS000233]SOD37593.1 Phage capsid scaffolding protein (GPO) serine peptidase [Pantoea floridensis]
MPKSKLFRVAVEGATCDGRQLERQHIQQIADTYNPQVYGARINLEHLKSLSPDSTFRIYGDVDSVQAIEIKEGPLAGKLGLYALNDGTDDLVTLNKSRQKVYSSIEFDPNFADSGKAYLMGLAFTDSPASLGTEMLQFSSKAAVNPLANRKTNKNCFFSEAYETAIEFEAEVSETDGGKKFFSRIKDLITGGERRFSAEAGVIREAVEIVAESQGQVLDRVEALSQQQGGMAKAADVAKLTSELAELKTQLSSQDGSFSQRPPSSGGNGVDASQLADC